LCGRIAEGTLVPRILVADDNTNIQKMVALAFEERGISVVSVGNGEAAVRRIPDMNPDLVLADVFMPVRNGYEVCEFVKKDERFAHVPVILLVGAFDPLDEREARRVGADGVLKKPFVPPDPLIAMVTSALERNPKVAAEMAKARETPKEPELPPMPVMKAPTKREPTPVPDFPEPTPEEAAQIYGFGKGVRGVGEDVKDGKPPVGMKEEEEGEFDDSATSNDWRRTAGMDLEIPEGATAGADYDLSKGFSGGFSPERQTAAQRSASKELEETDEPVAAAKDSATSFFAPAEPPAAQPEVPAASFSEEPAQASPSGYNPMAVESPVPEAQFADDNTKFELPAPRHSEPEPVSAAQFVPESVPQAASEPEVAPRATHWMDMMSPGSAAKYSTGGSWMTDAAAPVEQVQSQPQAQSPVQEVEAPGVAEPVPQREPVAQSELVAQGYPAAAVSTTSEPEPSSFFADEPKKAEPWFSVPPPVHDVVQEKVREIVEQVASTPQAQQVDARPAPDFGHEIVLPHDSGAAHEHDAEPEPERISSLQSLFSNELASATRPEQASFSSSGHDSRGSHHFQQPEHEHVFEPAAEAEAPSAQVAAPQQNEAAAPEVQSAPTNPESEMFSERIPTGYPPNREALADIPFLQPPPPTAEPSSETVDAVVARVLEKLEPQLHDLLSKGVLKPLVENLLQAELGKKTK